MRIYFLLILTILFNCCAFNIAAQNASVFPRQNIYFDTWTNFNKNGEKDIYEDSKANIDARIENLLSQMTLEEKTNQPSTLYG